MLTESFNLGFSKPGGTVNLSSMAVELVARVRQGLAQVLIPQSFPFFFFVFERFSEVSVIGLAGSTMERMASTASEARRVEY
jgi:hypothetical protein